MNIYSIYKTTCLITGKAYIGFDSNWPSRRQSHYYKSRSNKSQHFYLHNAIRKHGWDNFKWEIIYQSKDNEHTLKIMESYFIKEYDTYFNGYNQTVGGEGSFGKLQTEKNKKDQSKRRSEYNKKSRWYNNGKENKFSIEHHGEKWIIGRLNQKPTTLGCKWYNNGKEQLLTKNQPKDWIKGMIPK